MKIVKRLLISVGVLFILLLATAVIIPVFFKDKIMAVAKKAMNEQLNATADFKDIDISILRNFPRLSVGITDIYIVGKDDFKNDTLLSAKSVNVALDLMKAINGTYDILNIGLVSPRIHAIVLENGKPNWDIAKPSTDPTTPEAATESAPFAMKLRKYSIENAFIEYDDKQGKMHAIIYNLIHTGSGDFSSDEFTLTTNTTADAITFINGGVPYLNKVKTSIDLDLNIDNKNSKYSFNTEKIQLNGLKLYTKGFVQMPDTSNIVMDVQFGTPSNDFKDILSLVPGIYTADFKDIKTTGKLALNGFVKGKYNATQMPSFMLNLGIENGSFQYPALPQKIGNIQVALKVTNPDGITDHTVINLDKCHIEFGAEPFDLKLLLRNPETQQWVDASAKGHIDLSRMTQLVALEAGTKISGDIKANVAVKGPLAEAQKKQFNNIDASGNIDINNLAYTSKDYPDGVNIYSLLLSFNPSNVTVANLKGKYMTTNFSGKGSVDNMLEYFLSDQSLSGSFTLMADQVDVNKFMGTEPAPTATHAETTAVTDPFIVPNNLNLELNVSVATVKYDNITLKDVGGALAVRNETVYLNNINGKAFDGSIRMNGSYSTKNDKKNPDIAFDYDIIGVDIQKTFNSFETIQKMMPTAKYMSGKVTSSFSMNGKLAPDMMPAINTISGKGELMLLNGLLSGSPITEQLAEKLKLTQLKSMALKDMKLFFEFANGRMNITPFNVNLGSGITADVAGSHGFDQTLSYGANIKVPRSLMGTAGNTMVNGLVNQAAGKGIPIKLGETINFTAKVTGTSTKPKIEVDLKNVANDAISDVKEEIKKVVEHKIDSVKSVVKDTVKAIKQKAIDDAKEEAKKQLTGTSDKKPEEAVKDAADKAKEGLKGLFGKKKK